MVCASNPAQVTGYRVTECPCFQQDIFPFRKIVFTFSKIVFTLCAEKVCNKNCLIGKEKLSGRKEKNILLKGTTFGGLICIVCQQISPMS